MCLRGGSFFSKIVNKQLKIVNKISKNEKKLTPLKRILALPTLGQKCIVLEVQPFEITDFDLGYPVLGSYGN